VRDFHEIFIFSSHANVVSGTNTLPAPSANKVLSALSLARGNLSYSCTSGSPASAPFYISQQTQLFDVAPLIQYIPTEAAFHSLVAQFYSYDYAELTNSSLVCNGEIYTHLGKTTVDLTGHQPFFLHVNATIPAPNPQTDSYWAQSLSQAYDWEVYRVETAGGAIPTSCAGLGERFEIGYAAEYWFYHS
jgi:hypothetical protein